MHWLDFVLLVALGSCIFARDDEEIVCVPFGK